ncbi:MAG: histidine kinase [Brevundimonas sp.]|nr:MAG: histidine kinase [Brevundimonas sp.]
MSMSRVLGTSDPVATPKVAAPVRARVDPNANSAAAFFRQPFVPIFTALSVLVLVVLAIQFGRSAGLVAALWGASGVAVGMWLRSGRGVLYDLCFGALITVGVIAGELMAMNTYVQTALFTVANMVEIGLAVALVRRFAPPRPTTTVRGSLRLMVLIGLVAPLPSAAIATAGLFLLQGADPVAGFQTWWFGHALGLAIIVPMILAADQRLLDSLKSPARAAEWVVLFAVLVGALWFGHLRTSMDLSFVALPVLVIITARLRTTGIALGLILMVCFAILGALMHRDGSSIDLAEKVLLIQLHLLFALLPFMLLAVLLDERDGLGDKAVKAQKRAERASQAKSRLLANVAHEIKSPVGGIIGIGELWKTGQLGPVSATQDEMAGMLVTTARQIETLAHDLLDVARAESGSVKYELRPTDVVGVLDDVCRATSLRPDAQGLRFEVVGHDDGLVALADSQRLTQVVANLATNAVKYGSAGGVVIFRAMRSLSTVRIEVSDRGAGLTADKQAQLFEPFNRLGLERSTIEGHGIGLALAKSLIELQGGQIGVDSHPGQGATFWIELPAA